ncbi:unnamed protein product [Ectocarpus sp. 6 AP-2014]
MSPGHGGRSHGHGRHDDDDDAEWMQLLRPSEFREVLEIDRARQDVERQIIHSNQAKLAGRSEAERREWTTSGYGMAGVGASAARRRQDDVMSHLYSKASRGGQDDREAPPRSWRWGKAGPAPVAEDTGLGCGLLVGTSVWRSDDAGNRRLRRHVPVRDHLRRARRRYGRGRLVQDRARLPLLVSHRGGFPHGLLYGGAGSEGGDG